MKRNDVLKHLDRAFTQAPPQLSDRIEATFRRGEREMLRRHKIMTMLSVAAVAAVLFAAIALAAGTLVKPRVDRVVTSRGSGAGESKRAQAPKAEEETYYALPNGRYYHADEHCSGMEDAWAITEAVALAWGKEPCPICMADKMSEEPVRPEAEEATVDGESATVAGYVAARPTYTPIPQIKAIDDDAVFYATQQGHYFHADEHCNGMYNAWPLNIDAAWVSGKNPCPVCVDEAAVPRLWFYCTEKGQYYHIYADCSGMKGAQKVSASTIRDIGKEPCPVCIPGGFTLCWATPEGQYYHSERECMGMWTARIYTEVYAGKVLGKSSCPVCWRAQGNAGLQLSARTAATVAPEVPDALGLFRTAFGCELTDLWPDYEYLTTRRDLAGDDWECLLRKRGTEDVTLVAAVLSSRIVEDADGAGHDRKGEVVTPDNFAAGDLRMRLWQSSAADYASLLRRAPEPLRLMAEEAEAALRNMPDMKDGMAQSSADQMAWMYVCFDESRTVVKAVDLFVCGPDDVHFQWMLNGEGGYDLSFVTVNGEKMG